MTPQACSLPECLVGAFDSLLKGIVADGCGLARGACGRTHAVCSVGVWFPAGFLQQAGVGLRWQVILCDSLQNRLESIGCR
jgi:hypothetical protein